MPKPVMSFKEFVTPSCPLHISTT